MEKLIIDYFNQNRHEKSLSVIAEKGGVNFHETIYPRKRTGNLKWDAINATVTNVAAPTKQFGSGATKTKRDNIEVATGKILPIEIAYNLDEEMILNLNNPNYRDIVIDAIFDDTLNSYNAVRARMDFIAMQQLSTGKVIYSADNNADGVIGTEVNYNLASWQEANAGTSWATSATATPLADIRDTLATLANKGIYPEVLRMNQAIFNNMVNTVEVLTTFGIKVSKANIQSGWISIADMNVFLGSKAMPTIEILRDDISYVKADGTFDNTRRAWAEGILQFGFKREGTSLWVEPVEYTQRNLTPALVSLKNGIVVQKYSELDPPSIITKAKGIMFPVWDNSSKSFLLDTTP